MIQSIRITSDVSHSIHYYTVLNMKYFLVWKYRCKTCRCGLARHRAIEYWLHVLPQPSSLDYRYLVISGGTVGLALVIRLSESGKCMAEVLEAGTCSLGVPTMDIPGYYGLDL